MSILIRKQCQELLDANQIPFVHVEIRNKTLTLVGQCGKPLVSISGIRFATNNPTKAEVAYATELFQSFLAQHATTIKTFIEAKKAFSEKEEPVYQGQGEKQQYFPVRISYSSEDGVCKVTLYPDQMTINISSADSVSDFFPFMLSCEADALPYFTALKEYREEEAKVADLASQLNQCNI